MDKLPQVLWDEIKTYIAGDRKYWKAAFAKCLVVIKTSMCGRHAGNKKDCARCLTWFLTVVDLAEHWKKTKCDPPAIIVGGNVHPIFYRHVLIAPPLRLVIIAKAARAQHNAQRRGPPRRPGRGRIAFFSS